MTTPYVVAGTIAKRRSWCIDRWYRALRAQTVRPRIAHVLLNDDDGTTESTIWRTWLTTPRVDDRDVAPYLVITKQDTGDAGYARVATDTSPRYNIENLSRLRNEWVARSLKFWPHATHLLSVDSDIVLNPDVVELLLAANLPVVAAVVRNSGEAHVYNFFCGADNEGPRRVGTEISVLAETEPQLVTMTGAAVLIRRDVAESTKYVAHVRGEDTGWSENAVRGGFGLYVHPRARTKHLQSDGSEWQV